MAELTESLHVIETCIMDPGEERRRSTLQPRRSGRSQSVHAVISPQRIHNAMKHHASGSHMIWSWSSFFRIYVLFTLLVLAVSTFDRASESSVFHKGTASVVSRSGH